MRYSLKNNLFAILLEVTVTLICLRVYLADWLIRESTNQIEENSSREMLVWWEFQVQNRTGPPWWNVNALTTAPTLLIPQYQPCFYQCFTLAPTIGPNLLVPLHQPSSHHSVNFALTIALIIAPTLLYLCANVAFLTAPSLLSPIHHSCFHHRSNLASRINLIMSINLKQKKNEQIKRKTKNHMKNNKKKIRN